MPANLPEKSYQKTVLEILSIKPIAFNPLLARITGSVKAGLFLSQLLYWWNKGKNEEWIYKTIEEIEEETALSRKEQDSAIRRLKQLGLVEVKVMGVPAKRHFKLNLEKIISLSKSYKQVCPKGTNWIVQKGQINTENTTENTTDIYNNGEASKEAIDKNFLLEEFEKKKKELADKLGGKINHEWQEAALRLAKDLGIDFETPEAKQNNLHSRWFKLFKDAYERGQKGKIASAYSFTVDYPKELNPLEKAKLFFWRFFNAI